MCCHCIFLIFSSHCSSSWMMDCGFLVYWRFEKLLLVNILTEIYFVLTIILALPGKDNQVPTADSLNRQMENNIYLLFMLYLCITRNIFSDKMKERSITYCLLLFLYLCPICNDTWRVNFSFIKWTLSNIDT